MKTFLKRLNYFEELRLLEVPGVA